MQKSKNAQLQKYAQTHDLMTMFVQYSALFETLANDQGIVFVCAVPQWLSIGQNITIVIDFFDDIISVLFVMIPFQVFTVFLYMYI